MRTRAGLMAMMSIWVLTQAASAEAAPRFARNLHAGDRHFPRIGRPDSPEGSGLAPTTWGFASHYSGSLYGTGYYPFKVDYTYNGTNSMYGNTYSYPSNGFVNDIRAIYAFDVSSLAGDPPPVWSSFMFDTREQPATGSSGSSGFFQIQLVSSGNSHSLQGQALFLGNGATNLDVYDAEDFENGTPFDNPELAFSGNNPLITTATVSTGQVLPLNIDVSNAVEADLGPQVPIVEVPALDSTGLGLLGLMLGAAGTLLLRRKLG